MIIDRELHSQELGETRCTYSFFGIDIGSASASARTEDVFFLSLLLISPFKKLQSHQSSNEAKVHAFRKVKF